MSFDDVEDAYVLSPIQKGMLVDSLSNPDSDVYVTYVSFDIVGIVDSFRFQKAWLSVFKRYQSLRTEFHWKDLDEPLQVVRNNVSLNWKDLDWSTQSSSQQDESFIQLIKTERNIVIDVSKAPLSRFNLIKLDDCRWRLLWSAHHLLADGLSTPVILESVLNSFTGDPELHDGYNKSIFQYSQYINWLKTQDHKKANDYWKAQLAGVKPAPTRLIRSRNNDVAYNDFGCEIPQIKFELKENETDRLNQFCQSYHITLSTFLHGAWALLLREFSGLTYSVFVSTVSGRHSSVPGMDSAVGVYLNAQPRVITTNKAKPLVEWLHEIQKDIFVAAKYDYSSLGEIQENITTKQRELPFESIITVGLHSSELDIGVKKKDLWFTNIEYQTSQSHYPLAFLAYPGKNLKFSLVFDKKRYNVSDIESMSMYLLSLLTAMLDSPQSYPGLLARKVAIDSDRASVTPIPDELSERYNSCEYDSIVQWFESTVDKKPYSVAVQHESSTLNFVQLDTLANKIARLVLEHVDDNEFSPVGLMLPRSSNQIAAMLGILKAGQCYIPIDPDYPQSAIERLIATARITLIIADTSTSSKIKDQSVVIVDVSDADKLSSERLKNSSLRPDSIAYIMFTSGSSGKPKGVQISHRNLMYSTKARIDYYQCETPNFLLLSSIAFDSSVAGIYWCLCGGGALVLPKENEEKDIQAIAGLISNKAITHTLCLPSYYQLLLEIPDLSKIDNLSTVIVAGEACSKYLVKQHFELRPGAHLFNEYGPTEACVWSCVYRFKGVPEGDIPIGKAIGTTYMQVVNEHDNPCSIGVEGEIVIGGPGVSIGYFNDSKLSDTKFITNILASEKIACENIACAKANIIYKTGDLGYKNKSGDFVFTGRIDRQLKIRGYRIEPRMIEKVLTDHGNIAQAAVVAVEQACLSDERNLVEQASRENLLSLLQTQYSEQTIKDAMKSLGWTV